MGQLERGIYDDNCIGMSQNEVNAHYGFDEDGYPLNGAFTFYILYYGN
jgi:hypothetical protein